MQGLCCEVSRRNLHFKTLQEDAVVAPGKSTLGHHQLQISHTGTSNMGSREETLIEQNSSLPLSAPEVLLGRAVLPSSSPPLTLLNSSQLENRRERMCTQAEPPPSWDTGLHVSLQMPPEALPADSAVELGYWDEGQG